MAISKTLPPICLEALRKARLWAEILTQDILNKKQEC
jgi:hypothetical protein